MSQLMVIKCIGCKADILQDHPNRRICSTCKKNKYNKGQRKRYVKKMVNHNCNMCNEQFTSSHNGTKFCSNKCRNKYWRGEHSIERKEKRIIEHIERLQLKLKELRK